MARMRRRTRAGASAAHAPISRRAVRGSTHARFAARGRAHGAQSHGGAARHHLFEAISHESGAPARSRRGFESRGARLTLTAYSSALRHWPCAPTGKSMPPFIPSAELHEDVNNRHRHGSRQQGVDRARDPSRSGTEPLRHGTAARRRGEAARSGRLSPRGRTRGTLRSPNHGVGGSPTCGPIVINHRRSRSLAWVR